MVGSTPAKLSDLTAFIDGCPATRRGPTSAFLSTHHYPGDICAEYATQSTSHKKHAGTCYRLDAILIIYPVSWTGADVRHLVFGVVLGIRRVGQSVGRQESGIVGSTHCASHIGRRLLIDLIDC